MKKMILFSLFVLVVFIASCAPQEKKVSEIPVIVIEEDPLPAKPTANVVQVVEEPVVEPSGKKVSINVEAFKCGYSPDPIKVNVGDQVTIHLTTRDDPHTFTINKLGINQMINPGIKSTVEFVPEEIGTYSIRSNIECGSGSQMMSGILIVEE